MCLIVFAKLCLKLRDFSLHGFELFAHFGELGDCSHLELLLANGRGRLAEDDFTVGHVVGDTRFGAQHSAISDMNVVANAHLAGHDNVVAGGRAAGDTDLATDEVMFTDAAVMGYLHQVIDFGAFADNRRSVGPSVDRGAGSDLDVGADFDIAELGGEFVPSAVFLVAESRRPPGLRRRE